MPKLSWYKPTAKKKKGKTKKKPGALMLHQRLARGMNVMNIGAHRKMRKHRMA